jgi:hypothetical protein
MYDHNDYEQSINIVRVLKEDESITYHIIANGRNASMVDDSLKCVIIELDAQELRELIVRLHEAM